MNLPGTVMVMGADGSLGRRVLAALQSDEQSRSIGVRAGDTAAMLEGLQRAEHVAYCVTGDAATVQRTAASFYHHLGASARRPRVVHLGSMSVYGSAEGRVDENHAPDRDLGTYAAAQLAAEGLASSHADAVIIRSGVEYGPDCEAWSGRVARWLQSRRLGDLGAAGDGICNLIFIDDLTRIVVAALRRPGIGGQTFNVAMDAKPTWNDYLIQFALALRAVPVRRIGSRRLWIESRLAAAPLKVIELGAARLHLKSSTVPPPIPSSFLDLCRRQLSMNCDKAQATFGMTWTSLDDGLKAAADFYRFQLAVNDIP